MTFHFDLVSPERLLFSEDVDQVDVPGVEGDFGVLEGHAPLVATLRPGILTVFSGGRQQRIVIYGGFAEVSPQGLTVLADRAVAVEDFDQAQLATAITDLEEDIADSKDDAVRDRLTQKLAQLRGVRAAVAGAGAAH